MTKYVVEVSEPVSVVKVVIGTITVLYILVMVFR